MSELSRPNNNTVNLKIGSERIKSNFNNVFNQQQKIKTGSVFDMFNEGRPRSVAPARAPRTSSQSGTLGAGAPVAPPMPAAPPRGRQLTPASQQPAPPQPSLRAREQQTPTFYPMEGYTYLTQTIANYLDDIGQIANQSQSNNIVRNTRAWRSDLAFEISEKLSNDGVPFSTVRGLTNDMINLYREIGNYVFSRRYKYNLIFNMNPRFNNSGLFDTDISVSMPSIELTSGPVETPETDPSQMKREFPSNEELQTKAREVVRIINTSNVRDIEMELRRYFRSFYDVRVDKSLSLSQEYQNLLNYITSLSNGAVTGVVYHSLGSDGYEVANYTLNTVILPPAPPAQPAPVQPPSAEPVQPPSPAEPIQPPSPAEPVQPVQPVQPPSAEPVQPVPGASPQSGSEGAGQPVEPGPIQPTENITYLSVRNSARASIINFDSIKGKENIFKVSKYTNSDGEIVFKSQFNEEIPHYSKIGEKTIGNMIFNLLNNLVQSLTYSTSYALPKPIWFGPESNNNELPTSPIDLIACIHDQIYIEQKASGFSQNREADVLCINYANILIYWASSKLMGFQQDYSLKFIVEDLTTSNFRELLNNLNDDGLKANIAYSNAFINVFNTINNINPLVDRDTVSNLRAIDFFTYKELNDEPKKRMFENYAWAISKNKIDLKNELPAKDLMQFLQILHYNFIKFNKESSKDTTSPSTILLNAERVLYQLIQEIPSNQAGRRSYLNELIVIINEFKEASIDFTKDEEIINLPIPAISDPSLINLNMSLDINSILEKIGISHFVVYR